MPPASAGPSRFDLPTVPNPLSIGKMEIAHGGPGPHTGAAMRACFGDVPSCDATGPGFGLGLGIGPPPPVGGIFASAFAVVPGGDPAESSDVMMEMPAPPVTLASSGTYLHTTLKPNYLGGVVLGTILHVGPHPNTIPVPHAPVPEPSCALLVLCGFVGYRFGRGRRRRCD
jgi:hypothetical protein